MPLCSEFKFCDKFEIKKITFCSKKTNQINEYDFKLVKANHKKYASLIPRNNNYIFFKVLVTKEIISVNGNLMSFFSFKEKDFKGKTLGEIKKYQMLFTDFIEPLFDSCLEKDSAYQFDFELKNKKFSCSLYPCYIPNSSIASVDIIIRYSQHSIITKNKDQFQII